MSRPRNRYKNDRPVQYGQQRVCNCGAILSLYNSYDRCGACRHESYKTFEVVEVDPFADETPKWCPTCEQDKARTEFYRDRSRGDGLGAYCKPCKTEANLMYSKASSNDRV